MEGDVSQRASSVPCSRLINLNFYLKVFRLKKYVVSAFHIDKLQKWKSNRNLRQEGGIRVLWSLLLQEISVAVLQKQSHSII